MHAAKEYGVDALGCTLSTKQAELGNRKIQEAGLAGKCRVEIRDYRDLNQPGSFDKIVMMEVGEHFGPDEFPGYFRKCFELLKPGGVLLLQQITLFDYRTAPTVKAFGQQYIFPDGQLVHINWLVEHAERAGFDVRDVECIREHYPKTLTHWLGNLEANHDELVKITDEATYRTFRLYLAGAKYGFVSNLYSLYHLMVVKPDATGVSPVPPSRRDWFTPDTRYRAGK
jgi:cyclopropane-fatty-acyl-phospholipid synthase